jgi:CheY-like chemotaxis protein/nitrogen-specific signal transduction histidine kinase/HPt (histidine-containing phosphotransfer) domain-containing protein
LDGEISGFIEVVQDITDVEDMHKSQADAEEASAAKSMFLAKMSHEIRTPMNAVLGMSELLLQEKLNKRQSRFASDIKISAMALLDIINDILDVTKIQSGKFNLVPIHYDFAVMIDNIGSIVGFMIQDKDLKFILKMQEQGPIYLYGDNVRLRQVLLNLLSNAVKFTEKGYVQLEISFTETTVRMTVSDTGAGIPAESIPTLFDAFEQADVEKHRDKKGTGLGLTISKSIVEMMDGRITVESVYGKGTSFIVDIPRIAGDEALSERYDDKDIIIYAPDASILVVDDNKTNLNVACGLLKLCGISAEAAQSGREAIELIKRRTYDIVFMDHRMPGMSGTETTKAIRELGLDVTIIALTASAVVGAKEMMLSSGMDDFLWKPIKKAELVRILKKWIPEDKLLDPQLKTETDDENEDEENEAFWAKIAQINGLSMLAGLERVGYQRDVYESSLKLMIHEITKSEKNLPEFLSAGEMESFRIEVHGIKGALSNIAAMELSAKALELETASAEKDAGFCGSNLPGLILGLGELKAGLNDAFSLLDQEGLPAELPQELAPIFGRMKEAFAEMDLTLVDKETERLDALNPAGALKQEIERIKDMVMMMDYDGAAELMDKLLKI